jgi:hypothetical protein
MFSVVLISVPEPALSWHSKSTLPYILHVQPSELYLQKFRPYSVLLYFAAYWNVSLLVTSFSLPRPGFNPGSVRMGFMVDNMALVAISRLVLWLAPVIIILPLLHTHCHRRRYVILASDSVFK